MAKQPNVPAYSARNKNLLSLGLTTDVNADSLQIKALSDFINALKTGNDAQFPLKVVRNMAGRSALLLESLCLETVCILVDPVFNTPKSYVLHYTPFVAGVTLRVYRDGSYTPDDYSDAAWYDATSPFAGIRAFGEDPPQYAYVVGDLRRGYVADAAQEQIFRRKSAGYAAPPTVVAGDANWERINEKDAPHPNAPEWEGILGDPLANAELADLFARKADLIGGKIPLSQLPAGIGTKTDLWVPGRPAFADTAYLLGPGYTLAPGWYQPKADLLNSGSVSLTYYNRLGYLAQSDVDTLIQLKADLVAGKVPASQLPTATATVLGMVRAGKGLRGTGVLSTTAVDYVTEQTFIYDGDQEISCVPNQAYALAGYPQVSLVNGTGTANGLLCAIRNIGTTSMPITANVGGSIVDHGTVEPGATVWFKALAADGAFERVLATGGGGSAGPWPSFTNPVTDDVSNFYRATAPPNQLTSAIQTTVNGGLTVQAATESQRSGDLFSLYVGVGPVEPGMAGWRVRGSAGRPPGPWLFNLIKFEAPAYTELVPNADFSSQGVWALSNGSTSIPGDGLLYQSAGPGQIAADLNAPLVGGRTYELTVDITELPQGYLSFGYRFNNNFYNQPAAFYLGVSTYRFTLPAGPDDPTGLIFAYLNDMAGAKMSYLGLKSIS